MSAPVVVIGAGGHAKVVVATLQAAGRRVEAALDDRVADAPAAVLGVPVRGATSATTDLEGREAVIAIGANRDRQTVAAKLGLAWTTATHPRASVHDSVSVGAGTVVFAGAIVQPDTRIGEHVIVNTAASVDHDCALGDFSHVAPGARLCGAVRVGVGALVGAGATLIPGVRVGDWAVVGAGSVVIEDVPAGATVVGSPARRHRQEAEP